MSTKTRKAHNNSKFKSHKKDKDWAVSFFKRNGKKGDLFKSLARKAQFAVGNYDYDKIQSMRVETESFIQKIINKSKTTKLNSTEKAHLSIHYDLEKKELDADLEKLKKYGLKATVTSDTGRLIKCIKIAENLLTSTKPIDEKNSDIYYIYRKINTFTISPAIKLEYEKTFKAIEKIVLKVDSIKLQFTKFHGNMPPADNMKFTKLEEWQKELLNRIDKKESTIVQVSTSGGKSIVSLSLFKTPNIKALVCLPTDALCWQTKEIIEKIIGHEIIIITKTHQSETEPDKLIKAIERTGIVVGTARYLLDYLPFIKIKFDWTIFDEIHMIGSENSKEMEIILKKYNDIPTLLLSATIGNVNKLKEWMIQIGYSIDVIICNKKFFEIEKFVVTKNNVGAVDLFRIHPLASVDLVDFESGSILSMALNPTPPDTWALAEILVSFNCPIDKLNPYKYFTKIQIITLDEANEYFNVLIKWMVDNYKTQVDTITKILFSYKNKKIKSENISLYDVITHLKHTDDLPAIIFHTDSHACLELAKELGRTIDTEEDLKYPNLRKERIKEQKIVDQTKKGLESIKYEGMGEKQQKNLLVTGALDNISNIDVSFDEPHPDFIFNKTQYFSQHTMDKWTKELKDYFPSNGSQYPEIMKWLWRGIGVYVKGLPDSYLHLVQTLACRGELSVILSDDSLVFGVSMPIRTCIITNEKLNAMLYYQMIGRAGRRGVDKKAKVIILDRTLDESIKLVTSIIPTIKGRDTMYIGLPIAEKISDDPKWNNITTNFLADSITNEEANEYYSQIKENISEDGGWNFINSKDPHFLHMIWRLRQTEDCIKVPFLINRIRKIFTSCNPSNENSQKELAKFLLQFIHVTEATSESHVLTKAKCSEKYNLFENFSELGLIIPDKVDSCIYDSIDKNKLLDVVDKNTLRNQLFNFGETIIIIQHYFFYNAQINKSDLTISRLLSKLLTRIWWIYHASSPIMNTSNFYIHKPSTFIHNALSTEDEIEETSLFKLEESSHEESEDSDESDDSSDEESDDSSGDFGDFD
jgi:hypothetical protein